MSAESEVETFLVEESDEEYFSVVSRMPRYVGVLWVERIFNPFLLQRYLNRKEDLQMVCGDNLKEMELFHGTSAACMRKIIAEGFKSDKNVSSMFGKGTYFAPSATKSLSYVKEEDTICYMFLCDVLVGRQNIFKEVDQKSIEHFDCWVDRMQNPIEIVVPLDDAIYPKYVIALDRNPQTHLPSYSAYSDYVSSPYNKKPEVKGKPLKREKRT